MSENQSTTKKLNSKMIAVIGAAAVIIIALIAGISIFNNPGSRLTKQLDLGNRYLEEQNYEQAAIAFEEAITIDDRCIEAYAGGILAYQQLGDQESLTDIYERSLQAIAGLDEAELAENMEAVVGIYLAAEEVYGDNPARVIEILEDGFSRTGDQRIKDKLVERYLELANTYVSMNDIDMAIQVLTDGYEKTGDERLLQERQNLMSVLESLQKIYDLMAAEDYENAIIELTNMAFDMYGFIYIPNAGDSLTGLGVEISTGESICYGGFVEGKLEGKGVSVYSYYSEMLSRYYIFTGEWKHGAPNGSGEYITIADGRMENYFKGNLVEGLWDGTVDRVLYIDWGDRVEEYDFSASFIAGVPQDDKTEEYLAAFDRVPDDSTIAIDFFMKNDDGVPWAGAWLEKIDNGPFGVEPYGCLATGDRVGTVY